TCETRHLYLHETCQRERERRDRRPPEGGSSPNPSPGDGRAAPRRAQPPRGQACPPEIRVGAGASVAEESLPSTEGGIVRPRALAVAFLTGSRFPGSSIFVRSD